MSNRSKIVALALAFLAGCTVGPNKPPPDVDLTTPPLVTIPAPKIVAPSKPLPATNPIVLPPTKHIEPPESWVSLDHWCEANGFPKPRRSETDDTTAYSFASTNGTMVVRIGSQIATWRGMECHLGFAPESMESQPYVYSLDIRKNLLPLLELTPPRLYTNHTIVIDPGHGGTDTGTKNVFNDHYEKEYTLDLAKRLRTLLTSNGWTVWLTRTNDVFIALTNRVAFAEQHKAELFVSLHYNSAFPDEEESGLETYCLTPKGMPSNLTRGFKDDASLEFPNNNFDTQNLQLAALLHRAVLKVNGRADRGLRHARFLTVLQGQNRPAILMEGGYLSNQHEARRIADPAYRQKVAEALAAALTSESGGSMNIASLSPAPLPATNNPPAATNQTDASGIEWPKQPETRTN